MNGVVSILNCASGDTKITFDPEKPEEVERAQAIVTDMLRNGYVLAVKVEGKMVRATGFDPATGEYIITDIREPGRKKKQKPVRVKASKTEAVAVGRTAGGALGYRAFGFPIDELRRAQR